MWHYISSSVESAILLHDILHVNTIIVTNKLSCSSRYIADTLIWYSVQNITKAWRSLRWVAEMRLFYKTLFFTSRSIRLGTYLTYCQGRKTALLQDHRSMILQIPVVLWAKKRTGSWVVGEISSRRRGFLIGDISVSGALQQRIVEQYTLHGAQSIQKLVMYNL